MKSQTGLEKMAVIVVKEVRLFPSFLFWRWSLTIVGCSGGHGRHHVTRLTSEFQRSACLCSQMLVLMRSTHHYKDKLLNDDVRKMLQDKKGIQYDHRITGEKPA